MLQILGIVMLVHGIVNLFWIASEFVNEADD